MIVAQEVHHCLHRSCCPRGALLVLQVTRFLLAAMSGMLAEGIWYSPGHAPKLIRLFSDGVVFEIKLEAARRGVT